MGTPPYTPSALRRELSARNLARATSHQHEATFGDVPSVIYTPGDDLASHGNFIAASYRRIIADPAWRERLEKAYTGAARVPRQHDRRRAELDCASSSDALLMNIFCYPGFTGRRQVQQLLGIDTSCRPQFGVRADLPMRRGEVDRTELDMVLGPLCVEAKLTETGFQTASRERLLRYSDVEAVFDVDDLPWGVRGVLGYQLIRGILAAATRPSAKPSRFVLLYDARRPDLAEMYFRVLSAVRSYDLRSRMASLSWQELAAASSETLQEFLAVKYGIVSHRSVI